MHRSIPDHRRLKKNRNINKQLHLRPLPQQIQTRRHIADKMPRMSPNHHPRIHQPANNFLPLRYSLRHPSPHTPLKPPLLNPRIPNPPRPTNNLLVPLPRSQRGRWLESSTAGGGPIHRIPQHHPRNHIPTLPFLDPLTPTLDTPHKITQGTPPIQAGIFPLWVRISYTFQPTTQSVRYQSSPLMIIPSRPHRGQTHATQTRSTPKPHNNPATRTTPSTRQTLGRHRSPLPGTTYRTNHGNQPRCLARLPRRFRCR
jgi:hypothetical protein